MTATKLATIDTRVLQLFKTYDSVTERMCVLQLLQFTKKRKVFCVCSPTVCQCYT